MSKTKRKNNSSASLNRREFMKFTAGSAAVLIANSLLPGNVIAADQYSSAAKPKNILFIMTDQQYLDTIAAGGCPYVNTPVQDKLMKRGVSFMQSFAHNPVCSPARSTMLTGRTSSETGVYTNGRSIRATIPNLGQWFTKNTDYEAVYAGKWHTPRTYSQFIPGFKVINTGISGMGHICDTIVSRACEGYIRNRPTDKPFLMVASFMQPHDICEWLRLNTEVPENLRYPELTGKLPPLPPNFDAIEKNEPDKIIKTRQGRDPVKGNWTKLQWRYYLWSYYRHIEAVDAEIGRLLQALEETGRDKDTLIVLTSDHGEGLAQHQMVRKSTFYETAIKVPLIFSWPGQIQQNKINTTHLVTGLDIMPTICDYAGVTAPENMRGISLRGVLEGKSQPSHKYVVCEVSTNTGRMVHTAQYKYIVYKDDPVEQLFDMKKDPYEKNNLAADSQYASVIAEHKNMLKEWESKLKVHPNVPNTDAWWYKS